MNFTSLYKAKELQSGEWILGNLMCLDNEDYRIATSCLQNDEVVELLSVCAYKIQPATICRCTGILDKNNKLIWENDIIDTHEGDCFRCVWNNETASFNFVSKENKYCITYDGFDAWVKGEIEVVGNVFDNPEIPK